MSSNSDKMLIGCIGFVCIYIVVLTLLFFIIAGLTYVVCLGFGIDWNWLIPAAAMALMLLFSIAAKVIG